MPKDTRPTNVIVGIDADSYALLAELVGNINPDIADDPEAINDWLQAKALHDLVTGIVAADVHAGANKVRAQIAQAADPSMGELYADAENSRRLDVIARIAAAFGDLPDPLTPPAPEADGVEEP